MDRIVVSLSARRAERNAPTQQAKRRNSYPTAPVTSLPLVLRSAPQELDPQRVALDLLAAGSNAAAAPVWAERKAAFLALLHQRGQHGPSCRKIAAAWVDAVTAAGLEQKERRRRKREAEIAAAEKFITEEFG